jgi:hypothetical protein
VRCLLYCGDLHTGGILSEYNEILVGAAAECRQAAPVHLSEEQVSGADVSINL